MTQNRNPIALLPDALVNKIAAGEVVERPASVVKELLENSLDAGATRLRIDIEDGGRTLIRIVDNGCGIPPEEFPLAFAQHATSKIHSADDLFAIATMGFRGEALASIASVSHATLVSRTVNSEQAYRVEFRDGRLSQPAPAAAPVGTTLEIRDLFYSVPARRKFLRSDSTEFSHIHEMVLRIALPNPGIAITLTHNGRSVLDLPITGDGQSRVSAALGRELHSQLMPVDFNERGVRVAGYIGQPSLARATAKYQYIFLNGRYIRDRSLLHALKEAYRGLIEPIAQPVAFLMIQLDPAMFDVNVHPQKTEVRFREPNAVYAAVLASAREKLLGSDLTPAVKTANRFDAPTPAPGGSTVNYFGSGKSAAELSGVTGKQDISETRRLMADFFKQAPAQENLSFSSAAPQPSPIEDPSRITVDPGENSTGDQCGTQSAELSSHHVMPPTQPATTTESSANAASPETSAPAAYAPQNIPRFIQFHNTYLIVEQPDGMLIIDQHALHERILYEELYARCTRGILEGQRLLLPEIMPISPRHQAALEQVQHLLTNLGIEITPAGEHDIAVHTFPSLLRKVNPREFLTELLDKLLELGSKLTPEDLLHEVLDMASCKAAVKAGYPLSHDEIAALLARKEQVDRSSNCPHGRPTTLRLTIGDLEHQFKRK